MDFPFCGQRSPPVLLFSRVVCKAALSSEKSHTSRLYPATFLDLPLRVLEVCTLFPPLTLKTGYSAQFGASICFQLLLKLSVLLGPLHTLQMIHSVPKSPEDELLKVYWNLVYLSSTFCPFWEGRLIANIMTNFCWVILAMPQKLYRFCFLTLFN